MSGKITTDTVELRSAAAPAAPGAGRYCFYVKNDGYPYYKDPLGVERALLLSTVPETDKILLANQVLAWGLVCGSDYYMRFRTADGSEEVTVGPDPVAVSTSALRMRAGLGGWLATSTGVMHLDASGAVEINSSAGPVRIAHDAVNQDVYLATGGTRTLHVGSISTTLAAAYSAAHTMLKAGMVSAYTLADFAGNMYLNLSTDTGSEDLSLGNAVTNPTFHHLGSGQGTFVGPFRVGGVFSADGGVSTSEVVDLEDGAMLQVRGASGGTGQVVERVGATDTEGMEHRVYDAVVSPNAVETALFTVPPNSCIDSVQCNVNSALTGGVLTVTFGIGITGDVDRYGTVFVGGAQADSLAHNAKINSIGTVAAGPGAGIGVFSPSAVALKLIGAATGGTAAGGDALTGGSVRVVVRYRTLLSLPNT